MDGELESIVSCYNIGWGGDQIMEGKEFPQKKKIMEENFLHLRASECNREHRL